MRVFPKLILKTGKGGWKMGEGRVIIPKKKVGESRVKGKA